jgi:hypothetical protein
VLGDGCKPSDWHSVSSCCVLGVRYKSIKWHLVSSVHVFGLESDVSPAIGIQIPCLPVVLFACVSRATDALILLSPRRYVCIGSDILASMFSHSPNYFDTEVNA